VLHAKLSVVDSQTPRFALLAACLVRLAAMASPATPQPQQPTPAPENNKPAISLRVTTRLVQVNVVVNDKNGRPILGVLQARLATRDHRYPPRSRIAQRCPALHCSPRCQQLQDGLGLLARCEICFSGALKATGTTVRARCIGDRMGAFSQEGWVGARPGRASKRCPLPNLGQARDSAKERRVRLSHIQAFGCEHC